MSEKTLVCRICEEIFSDEFGDYDIADIEDMGCDICQDCSDFLEDETTHLDLED